MNYATFSTLYLLIFNSNFLYFVLTLIEFYRAIEFVLKSPKTMLVLTILKKLFKILTFSFLFLIIYVVGVSVLGVSYLTMCDTIYFYIVSSYKEKKMKKAHLRFLEENKNNSRIVKNYKILIETSEDLKNSYNSFILQNHASDLDKISKINKIRENISQTKTILNNPADFFKKKV